MSEDLNRQSRGLSMLTAELEGYVDQCCISDSHVEYLPPVPPLRKNNGDLKIG